MPEPTNSEFSESPESSLASNASEAAAPMVEYKGVQLWLSNNRELVFRLSIIAFVIGFVVFGTVLWLTDSLNLESVGYGGLWIVSFIAAGSIGYPIKKFLMVVFVAKAIKSTSIAYACFWGIDWIQGYFG